MATSSVSQTFKAAVKGAQRWTTKAPVLQNVVDTASHVPKIAPEHEAPMGSWTEAQIREATAASTMLTWMPGKVKNGLPIITHGEGVYVYDKSGKQYLDWTSQAVCSNVGYDLPPAVKAAVVQQMEVLPFAYGGLGIAEVRARLSSLMTDIMPGDLQGMVFPSSGAEANEAAIMIGRRYTGKHKVINWYRSYHGGTSNALQATGDSRRWLGRDMVPGFVKAHNPWPFFFDYAGSTDAERTQMALAMLEEQILNEGPDTVAMLSFESIVGSGGVLIPPDGFMQGVRALCDKYGILLHLDEVMTGFGRTGKLFGFQNFEGVLPDIISCAKGITSSAIPMSMTAVRKPLMEYFEETSIGWGSTYQAHPVAMACAYEQVKHLIKSDIVGHVARMAPIMEEGMKRMAENHPSIKQYRSIGLFGCFDAATPDGSCPQLQHEAVNQAFVEYKKAYNEAGLIGLLRPPLMHVCPPLIISEQELNDGFERQDKALDVLDRALGF